MAKEEKGTFKGVNILTGRKIYLTEKEEKVIKEQWEKAGTILIWLFVIWLVFMLLIVSMAGCG